MRALPALLVSLAALLLTACAPQARTIASAPNAPNRAQLEAATWAFEASDIPVDPGFRFGRLNNGMRYVVRQNATPEATGIVRLEIAAGSLDETDSERGFAHFVEHMAFNGSTNVPEGEMVRLLERNGLAFGADTNAATSFSRTTYKLDLPRNTPELLDVALMLMRETASELTITDAAVDRERGVLLAEMRDRNSNALRNALNDSRFQHPEALYPERFPIGTAETLNAATGDSLRAFYRREYVPEQTTLVVIGDFDADRVEAEIKARFANWQSASATPAAPQPDAGPVLTDDGDRTAIYLDPALPERVVASKNGAWLFEPDTIAQRQENLLRRIGYAIVNRRLQRLARQPDPPFRGAGFGTGDVFEAGRTTRLIVDTLDRKWNRGLTVAAGEYRKAVRYGFSEAEVAEQVAEIRTRIENAAASADTRSHHALAGAIWGLVRDDSVPSDPRDVLLRFNTFAPDIAAKPVLAALRRDMVRLRKPLLRFRGRFAPEGGEPAIRQTWNAAMRTRLSRDSNGEAGTAFAYTDFGAPGTVAQDTREAALGIRTVRFANGVMLNLKQTTIRKDRIAIKLSVDGGKKLNRRDNPLATELVRYLVDGGLGAHSWDELQTILAGKSYSAGFSPGGDTFIASANTTPRDLETQLQVFAAFLSDPGYRSEGVERYRSDINRYFAQLTATPNAALRGEIGKIISDGDPRFSLLEPEKYRALTFEKLEQDITDRLSGGALEIGIVGDFDEDQTIALVAQTLGALPAREPAFRDYADQPQRTFTAQRSRRIVRHTGPKDQALLRLTWPTRDDSDPVEAMTLELLERVVKIELTETLREALGKAYSPGASSSLSRHWSGYGVFAIAASVDVGEVAATRKAIIDALTRLRDNGIGEDRLIRARQPMIEQVQNALKSNSGWLALVDRAQTEPDRIARYLSAQSRLEALRAHDVRDMARRYLDPEAGLEILVLPEGVAAPGN